MLRPAPILLVLALVLASLMLDLPAHAAQTTDDDTPDTPGEATEEGETLVDWPCEGCVTVIPPGYDPKVKAPLLVALHGDEGHLDYVLETWTEAAEDKGVILFAPKCPEELGCEGSWWKWGEDMDWLMAQVDEVEYGYSVDLDREYLLGWSGGSTYLGTRLTQAVPRFAAVAFTGGGVRGNVCPLYKIPAYFLIGKKDLMFKAAHRFQYFLKKYCGHKVVWRVLKKSNHIQLLYYLETKWADKVLTWLLKRSKPYLDVDDDADIALSIPWEHRWIGG